MDKTILLAEFNDVYDKKHENLEEALLHLRLMGAAPVDTLKVLQESLV